MLQRISPGTFKAKEGVAAAAHWYCCHTQLSAVHEVLKPLARAGSVNASTRADIERQVKSAKGCDVIITPGRLIDLVTRRVNVENLNDSSRPSRPHAIWDSGPGRMGTSAHLTPHRRFVSPPRRPIDRLVKAT